MKKGTCLRLWIVTLVVMMGLAVVQAMAQTYGTLSASPLSPTPNVAVTNPMERQSVDHVCGNLTQQGTPIAGNAAGGGTSGDIDISGIPATAVVKRATLYWTVLTYTDPASSLTGGSINFNNNVGSGDVGVYGTVMGTADETPCFSQNYTIAWKADVTSLIPNPGNGTYSVSGFPGGSHTLNIGDFTEGATLQILWTEPTAPLTDVVVYETGSALAALPTTLSQTVSGFTVNTSGPVTGTFYEVIGNGQDASEYLNVTGPGGIVNLDDTLDGSTSMFAAGTCSFYGVSGWACFWDDDTPDISSALDNGATWVTMNYQMAETPPADCEDFPGVAASVSADEPTVCQAGIDYVNAQCPPDSYRNHGDYQNCVAHAANDYVGQTGCGPDYTTYQELHSCIANNFAKTDVGK